MGWVRTGGTLLPIALAGDWSNPLWQEPLENYGSPNPRIGVLVVGAVGLIAEAATRPNEPVQLTRTLMAGIAALSPTFLFLLLCGDRRARWPTVGAIIGVALLLSNPTFRSIESSPTPDVPMLAAVFVSLALMARMEQRGAVSTSGMLILATLLGVGVSTRLYAVALFPTALVLVAVIYRGTPRQAMKWLVALLCVGVTIFVATNPLLYSNPIHGLKLMTIDHFPTHGGDAMPFSRPGSLASMTTFPWPVSQPTETVAQSHLSPESSPSYQAVLWGVSLSLLGLVHAIRTRQFVAITWFISAFAVITYVVCSFPPVWIRQKVFLLPASGLVWLWTIGITGLIETVGQSVMRCHRARLLQGQPNAS